MVGCSSLYGWLLVVPMVIGAWWNPSVNDLVANWMGQSVGWLVVWVVVLLLLKCRTRRPSREAEVSCLFRDGSGRNSSMRCGENTPRERGCKKQQLSTLSIKVFTCIYSDSETLHHSSSIYNKDTILYINWYIQPLCFHSGIVACEENTEEETERMEPFYRRTRLNTAGLHRITLWETIQSGKNFYFWILFLHTLK